MVRKSLTDHHLLNRIYTATVQFAQTWNGSFRPVDLLEASFLLGLAALSLSKKHREA